MIKKSMIFIALVTATLSLYGCHSEHPVPSSVRDEIEETTELESTKEVTETTVSKETIGNSENDEDDGSRSLLINKYGLTDEELMGIDTERFVEDYALHNLDFTPEEVRLILSEQKDMYVDDGFNKQFKIFDKKSDDTATPDMGITKIGYYYNEGTLSQRVVIDLQYHMCYVDGVNGSKTIMLDSEDIDRLMKLDSDYHVFKWEPHCEEEEPETTGLFAWKLVFRFENGLYRSFDGYTGDMSHLPDNFHEVHDLFKSIYSRR